MKVDSSSLEDYLICDDLFYEYFSTFLSLPCFPAKVYYNRLTGGIELVESDEGYIDETSVIWIEWAHNRDQTSIARRSKVIGYPDERREHMLKWAAQDRLSLFLKSPLYREYKLCRFLKKPVDLSRKRSSLIRGYSVDTDAISSLNTAARSQTIQPDTEESSDEPAGPTDDWFRQLTSAYRRMRPSSTAVSLPPKLEYPGLSRYFKMDREKITPGGSFKSTRGGSSNIFSQEFSKARSATSSENYSDQKHLVSASNWTRNVDDGTSLGSFYNRVVSAPSNGDKSSAREMSVDDEEGSDDEDMDSNNDSFDEDYENGSEETATEGNSRHGPQSGRRTYLVENNQGEHLRQNKEAVNATSILERKHGRSMQEIKDKVVGNLSGMQSFRTFLDGTLGAKLYDFWLEVERFKDEYEPVADQEEKKRQRQLFRNILDLYGSLLTEEVLADLHQQFNDSLINRTTLSKPQYGAIRRLRAYWLPRYILHCERLGLLNEEFQPFSGISKPAVFTSLSFPTLSLGNWICSLQSIGFWSTQPSQSRPMSRMSSGVESRTSSSYAFENEGFNEVEPTLREKLISALMYENLGGSPFSRFARRDKRKNLLYMLNFHRDVAELSSLNDTLRNDRLLRRERFWSIFNKYIAPKSASGINCDSNIGAKLYTALSLGDHNKHVLKPSVFDEARAMTIDRIMPDWLDFLRTDALNGLSAVCIIDSRRDPTNGPSDRALQNQDAEFLSDASMLIIRLRKWVRRYVGDTPPGVATPSSGSARGRRNFEDTLWDEASQAKWRKWLAEQRRSADRWRREAVRAANQRLAEQRKQQSVKTEVKISKPKQIPRYERENTDTQLVDRVVDNKALLSMFRKSIENVPESSEMLGAYQALLTFSKEEPGPKRDQQAVYIYKQYLEQQSPNHIPLDSIVESPELRQQLLSGITLEEGVRPSSPSLQDLRRILATKFSLDAQNFVKKQSELLGIDAGSLVGLSPDILRAKIRQAKTEQNQAKQREGRRYSTASDDDGSLPMLRRGVVIGGKAPPNREDKAELFQLLSTAAYGPFPRRLVAFRRYLCYFSDVDKVPLLENDFLFCIDAFRFKVACHPDQDDQWLKRRLLAVVESYLDTLMTPSCQLDITHDTGDRLAKNLRRQAMSLEFSPSMLEEPFMALMNAYINQYYAGFRRMLNEAPDTEESVLVQPTKKEKALIQRHRQFKDFKTPAARSVNRLPPVPSAHSNAGVMFSLHFTLSEGVTWKEVDLKINRGNFPHLNFPTRASNLETTATSETRP